MGFCGPGAVAPGFFVAAGAHAPALGASSVHTREVDDGVRPESRSAKFRALHPAPRRHLEFEVIWDRRQGATAAKAAQLSAHSTAPDGAALTSEGHAVWNGANLTFFGAQRGSAMPMDLPAGVGEE